MDSSIAPHLRRPRTLPTRKGADFQPPYPSFSARFPERTLRVVMAYFGVQYPGTTAPPAAADALAALLADLSGGDGAGNVERAHYVDEAGFGTQLVIAYWDDVETFDRWSALHGSWTDPARAGRGGRRTPRGWTTRRPRAGNRPLWRRRTLGRCRRYCFPRVRSRRWRGQDCPPGGRQCRCLRKRV